MRFGSIRGMRIARVKAALKASRKKRRCRK